MNSISKLFRPRSIAAGVRSLVTACLTVCAFVAMQTVSFAQPDLPATGVDVAALVTEMITDLGAVVAVIVGGYFAFVLIRKAIMWGRKAAG